MAETNTSTASISDYPQLPLLTIFDYVPLRNLLHIDEVCRAWQKLKPAACSRRRHLIIANDQSSLQLIDKPDLEYHRELGLTVGEIDFLFPKPKVRPDLNYFFIGHSRLLQATLDRLLELLPNLKVFRLVQLHGSHEELSKVNQLLAHYRHQLVEVKICFKGAANVIQRRESSRVEVLQHSYRLMFLSLMASLNRLTALRSLELNFQPPPDCPVVLDDRQVAAHCLSDVAGRLKSLDLYTRFEFGSDNSVNLKSDIRLLKQVLFRMRDGKKAMAGEEGSKLKQQQQPQPTEEKNLAGKLSKLTLQQHPPQPTEEKDLELYLIETPLTLKTLISLGPGPVAVGLRTIQIDGNLSADSAAEYKALARLARQSPYLQAVAVKLKSCNIRRLVESLASLKELSYLNIFCYPSDISSILTLSPSSPVDIGHLPVMPSVKTLRMTFPAMSHNNYEQLHLEVHFPSLKNIFWTHVGLSCMRCDYQIAEEDLARYIRDPNYLRRNAKQFKAKYGQQMQKCLRLARLTAFSRLPQLSYLFLQNRSAGLEPPFLDEVFVGNASLYRQTEFLLKENSSKSVVYID